MDLIDYGAELGAGAVLMFAAGILACMFVVTPWFGKGRTSSYSGEWDTCLHGKEFTLVLNEPRPTRAEAVAALDACYAQTEKAAP